MIAYDLSQQMLAVVEREARARGHAAIETRRGAAAQLPFDDASFDLIVTRSAHHWPSVLAAWPKPCACCNLACTLVVIDVVAPESALLDTVLQTIELLRDKSHVRNYRARRRSMLSVLKLTIRLQTWRGGSCCSSSTAGCGGSRPRTAASKPYGRI